MLNSYNQSIAMTLISIIASAVSAQQPPVTVIREQTGVLNFTDIDGIEHAVPCKKGTRGVVLVFINTECPIANAYHPTLRRLREEFSDSRFDFVMVHADANLKTDAARKHQKDYEITWPIVLDSGNKIARYLAAKVTPEAIVVDAKGDVLYRGRIDDRYQDYGRKRPEPATHDLKVAMQAIVEGKSVPTPETKAIGCVIRYVD